MRPLILGHRGFSKAYPENTLIAFENAYKNGADGIELDIRKTLDGEIVVIHDDNVGRVCEAGSTDARIMVKKISGMNIDELRAIELPMGQYVPRLSEVLEITPPGKTVNIELKEIEVAVPLCEMLKNYGRLDDIVFSSFIYEAIGITDKLLPEVRKALLVGDNAQNSQDPLKFIEQIAAEYRPFSLNLPVQAFDIFPYEAAKDIFLNMKRLMNLKFMWWTLDDGEVALKMAKDQLLDYIITNDVELMKSLLG